MFKKIETTAEENLEQFKEFCRFVKSLDDEEIEEFALVMKTGDEISSIEEIKQSLYKIKNKDI